METKCLNKNTNFYRSLVAHGFDANEIAQVNDKLEQEKFLKWYGEGSVDTFGQPQIVKDLYLVNDKHEQITLNDLLNDSFYEKRQNYSKDLTSLDKIHKFLEEARIGITKRISAYRGSEYAEKLSKLLEDLDKLNKNDYLQALDTHSNYILDTIEDFELRFYKYDKINTSKLSKLDKEKRDKEHKNFLIHASNFLQTFSKIKDLDIPSAEDSTERQIISRLKDIENRVTSLQNKVNADIEAAIRDTLNDLISNPEVRAGTIDFLAAQTDESKAQLLLDALGDSHVTFIAAIDKFFKRAMYEKDLESRQLNSEWDKFVEGYKGNFDTFLNRILEKKDGQRTGRFIQKYDESYYDTLYSHINKLKAIQDQKSPEYIEALNDYFNWKKENTEQKYSKEYYDTLNLLVPEAREAKEQIDDARESILRRDLNKLSIEDFEALDDLDKQMKALKSTVNADGTKKTDKELAIANSLFKYSKAMSKFYHTQGVKQKAFDKAKKEAKEKGEEYYNDWLKYNTKETFTDDFWTYFNNLVKSIPKSEGLSKIEDKIKQLLINYKNEKNEIIVDEIPKEVRKELEDLEKEKSILKANLNKKVSLIERRRIANEFKKHIEFIPSGEYLKTFADKKNSLSDEEFQKWYKENHETNVYTDETLPVAIWNVMRPKNKKFIHTVPSNRWNVTSIKPDYHNPNFKLDSNGFPNPTDKWISQEYKDLSPEDIEGLDEIQKRLLYLVEHTKNDIIKKGYLPAIPKDNRSALSALAGKKLPQEDSEKAITESDEIVKFIPFKYVKKLSQLSRKSVPVGATEEQIKAIEEENEKIRKENAKSHGEVLNYDLANTMKIFTKIALTNKYKSDIELDIKLFKEQLKRQKIKQIDAKGNKIFDKIKGAVKGQKVEHEVDASGSNTVKHFNEWLDAVFYEDFELDEGMLSNWTSKVQDFTSLRSLGFNVLSSVNNKVIGNIQERIEAAANQYYNYSNYRRARKEYFQNITHFIAKHKDKTSDNYHDAFLKYFDVLISQDELSNKPDGAIKTALYKLQMVKNAAFIGQHLGEHQIQNTTLLSMAYSHRIVDGKIKNFNEFFQDKQIKINFDKKMSQEDLDEQYKNIEKNYLLKESMEDEFKNYPSIFESFEVKNGLLSPKESTKLDKDELFNFKQRVIGINQRLHGIYNNEDAGTIQRYALGRLAIQFRKWMRPGWNRRFGSKFGKKLYNERIRDYEEGMYVTTFKFLSNPITSNYREFRKSEEKTAALAFNLMLQGFKETFTTAKIRWNTLSEMEKANIRRTAAEFLFLISVIAIGFLAKSLKGDDDDKPLTFVLYQADRLFGELTTYSPIGIVREGNRLFSSPSPVFNTFEDIFKLAASLFAYPFRDEEGNEFKSGIYHGQDKVSVYFGDMIPVYNQWRRILYLSEQNQRYGMFK